MAGRNNDRRWLATLIFTLFVTGGTATPLVAKEFEVVGQVPAEQRNAHYPGNREPLVPSPLVKLPVGSVEPQSWLRHQLELMTDGMTGRLDEISMWLDTKDNAWIDPAGAGEHGWEELPYWLKGYVDLGHILRDDAIIAKAHKWVKAVIASQREDGYFGWDKLQEKKDFWPHMPMLYAVRSYYEATGDETALRFMERYFRYLASLPPEQLFHFDEAYRTGWWSAIRAGDNLSSIYWLYNRTGEPWLLDLARVNHQRTADWTHDIPSWHGVNICQAFREPAQYCQQSHDPEHYQGTVRTYNTIMSTWGQVPGGMFGADENVREGFWGPRQGAETCSVVEFMHSQEILAGITGDARWADRCENIAFNTLPATMTPDQRALHYLTAPNQVQLDRAAKNPLIQNRGTMFSYTPYERYRCCQHNVAFGWPKFVGYSWMATSDNGLAAVLYGPGLVRAKVGDGTEVIVTSTTDYPFDDTIILNVSTPTSVTFPLYLRIPSWCFDASLALNGQTVEVNPVPDRWVRIERTFNDGDQIELRLPMKIKVEVWTQNKNGLSVRGGPLNYALLIGERWEPYEEPPSEWDPEAHPRRPEWIGFEVFPTTAWNFGLMVDLRHPAEAFTVVRREGPLPLQPFTPDNAPITLQAKGKQIPSWQLESNGMVGELPRGPINNDEPTRQLTLIPMGCARLRISVFPQVLP